MAEELRSLYLIAGTDGAKIDATRARLRARAESEGGAGALEVFEAGEGRGAPDHEALLGGLPAMSLTGSAATCSPTASSAGATASSTRWRRPSPTCRPT